MARLRPEPPHTHGQTPRTGVLVVNLGSPEAPTAAALRPYLKQFLSDPRVVEIPRLLWWPILNLIILNTRPAKSAEKYASIWTDAGSPLRVHTERQTKILAGYLGEAGHRDWVVRWAMRYGDPAIRATLEEMRALGCDRILVMPMYPQYAGSTTGSVMDEVARGLLEWRNLPELRFVRSYHDHPGYIAALADAVHRHWQHNGQAERLILSFHGVPRFTLDKGDPYHCECHKTARLLAEALGEDGKRIQVTFQSRFGKAEWLQPYTQPTLEALARDGVKSVDVMCPGFAADCLETLEEIAMECKTAFIAHGGRQFNYIPCLNEDDAWMRCLRDIVLEHAGHWCRDDPRRGASDRGTGAQHARTMGALQ
ncbi:ferrochelatase [Nitrogeniibacter mangrovi]|uniref:Ferrochelatase n=1 Tax=Nitrogeniibacter mangrovi TaxID=2016596 RepID=A0A6C1B7F1_9RHOO|nr:ferrochelatase [Nitrogeniibacter mangrovi]QID18164.1 ferrochelatase [Nitrogeniibacter mangrovi]